jgi:signal transduction histidine kinase
MSVASIDITQRERELGAIITAYNEVTEQLKQSHEQLRDEVRRLHEELARKNEQLRRRERLAALGEMAAGVAHEIRNPLGGIQVFASLLRRDVLDRPDALELVERIRKGVGDLESVVVGILEFGRPREPRPHRINLRDVVSETVDLALARAGDRPVRIEAGVDSLVMRCDGAMLQRALLNLVLNAVDAASTRGAQGVVKIEAAPDGDRVSLLVYDNGPGLPAEIMDRIFNPFFTTKGSGTGLGLAIVHQIVESLGGSVRAANRPEGGAVFTLNFALSC